MARNSETETEFAKYITEDSLPTEDIKYLCSIIGLEATKKLMFNVGIDNSMIRNNPVLKVSKLREGNHKK